MIDVGFNRSWLKIQTLERLKTTLFIRVKHKMRIFGGELVHLSFLADRTGANCILLGPDHMKQAWRATCQFSKSHSNKLHPSDVSLDKPRPPESVRTGSAHWGCLRPAQPFGTISNKLQLLGPFVTIHAHYNRCMTRAV